jgi:hypothetical protein
MVRVMVMAAAIMMAIGEVMIAAIAAIIIMTTIIIARATGVTAVIEDIRGFVMVDASALTAMMVTGVAIEESDSATAIRMARA